MSPKLPVLIIGAGISGLSLARLLKKYAIPSIVFESTSKLSRQGYGLTARAWAYEPLLSKLGLSADEFKAHVATDSASGGRGKFDRTLYELSTGNTLLAAPETNTNSPESDF